MPQGSGTLLISFSPKSNEKADSVTTYMKQYQVDIILTKNRDTCVREVLCSLKGDGLVYLPQYGFS